MSEAPLVDQTWVDRFAADPGHCTCRIASAGPIHLVLGVDECPVHRPPEEPDE